MSRIARCWWIGCVILGLSTQDLRAEVTVTSELELARHYNAASLRLWTAEANVTRLRLQQLRLLREQGHASWLEVAQAEVTLDQHLARQRLEQQMATYLCELSKHVVEDLLPRDVHAVRVIDPLSTRLIGWFETGEVVPASATQFSPTVEAPSAELIKAERAKAEAAQRRVDRFVEAEYPPDSLEFSSARNERDLAAARADLAELAYRLAQSERDVDRNLQPKRESPTNWTARHLNTTPLARATLHVVDLESKSNGPIELAGLILEKKQQYLSAIEQLHQDGHASQQEFESAQRAVSDATQQRDALIRRRDVLVERVAAQSAEFSLLDSVPADYWQRIQSLEIRHPTVVRHLIDLRRRRLTQRILCRTLEAQLNLVRETGDRLRAVSERESSERRWNDLDQRILNARIASANQLASVLEREELRFAQHLAPGLQEHASPVPGWFALALGQTTLGRLALGGIVVHHADKLRHPVVYFDTHSVIDPVSLCLTCDENPKCCSQTAPASRRLRSSASRIDMSWRNASSIVTGRPLLRSSSALVSEYDLQRICSYYCDLPGSFCPRPNLGTSRLFSSYAVPVSPAQNLVRHDDWLGIRTVSYGLSRTGFRKYSGLNYSGIPIYEPVIHRVKNSVRYRPSFRTP